MIDTPVHVPLEEVPFWPCARCRERLEEET